MLIKEHKKHKHAANLNLILNELRKTSLEGGLTLKELAELCSVSKRNIYRYLNEIEDMGFELARPVQAKPGMPGRGKYRLRRKTLPQDRLDTNLMMMLGLIAQEQQLYQTHLSIINEFFVRYLAAKYRLSLPVNWPPVKGNFNNMVTPGKNNVKSLPLNTTTDYETVKIIIGSPAVAALQQVQSDFHILRQETLSDGSLFLTLGLDDVNDILPWVFKFGDEAEIIEPRNLRRKIIEHCKDITRAYRSRYLSKKISYLQTTDIS